MRAAAGLAALALLGAVGPAVARSDAPGNLAETCWARRGEALAERGVVDAATAGCAAEGFAAAAEAAPDDLGLALRSLEADWFAELVISAWLQATLMMTFARGYGRSATAVGLRA